MNTVISYCIFEPLVMHSHRTWDENRMDSRRYWYNIPSLLIMNSILYPNISVRIYTTDSTQYHPLFEIFRVANCDVRIIERQYKTTSEPMLWRMMPCWDSDVECFFTRDVDSLPNRNEVLCTKFFEESDNYHIQTMRSNINHYHEQGCDMLGGLSGFKPKHIPNLPKTFDDYYNNKSDLPWAQDQYLMTNTFINIQDKTYLEKHFLDCPIDDQKKHASFPCTEIKNNQYNSIVLTSQQNMVLSIIEENDVTKWAGEPSDARGKITKKLLNVDNEVAKKMKELFNNNSNMRNFYYNENISKPFVS